jgi:hypothetical protein
MEKENNYLHFNKRCNHKILKKQFVFNPYLEHPLYYKFSGSEPNLNKIVVFNFNPHSLLVQAFSKKGIFKGKTNDKGKVCLTEKAKTLMLYYKYAGTDGFPCNRMQEEVLFFRKIFKIYQKYSNGSEACAHSLKQFEFIKFHYKKKKKFKSDVLLNNRVYCSHILSGYHQNPRLPPLDSMMIQLAQYHRRQKRKSLQSFQANLQRNLNFD